MENNLNKSAERTDELKQVGLKILQSPSQFCFGIDAILLSYYAAKNIRNRTKIIDICCGNGIIPLMLSKLSAAEKITGLEIQQGASELFERSIKINSLQEKISVLNGDVKEIENHFARYTFDYVTCNPPYAKESHGNESPNDCKAVARHEILCSLEDVIKAAEYLLKPNGSFYMIHRPNRCQEIFVLLEKYKMTAKKMRLVFPSQDSEPTMVLFEIKKNCRNDLKIEKPLVIYKSPGIYTDEVQTFYTPMNN